MPIWPPLSISCGRGGDFFVSPTAFFRSFFAVSAVVLAQFLAVGFCFFALLVGAFSHFLPVRMLRPPGRARERTSGTGENRQQMNARETSARVHRERTEQKITKNSNLPARPKTHLSDR